MNPQTEFTVVFEKLKSMLEPYSSKLIVKIDSVDGYSLDGPHSEKWEKDLFFGAAQVKKNYVSFYLMPVYMFPDLLKNISPELKSVCRESHALILRRLNLLFSMNLLSSLNRDSNDLCRKNIPETDCHLILEK